MEAEPDVAGPGTGPPGDGGPARGARPRGFLERLRSLRLAVALLILLAGFSMGGTLVGPRLRETEPALRTAGRLLGLAEAWRSPIILALAGLLVANIALCSWHRLRTRLGRPAAGPRALPWLDAAVHFSLVLMLAGGAARGAWGEVGTGYLFVGEEAVSMYDEERDRDVPLGFGVRLLERRDEYYPLRLRVGVRDAATGEKVAVLEPREGAAAALPDGSLSLVVRGVRAEPFAAEVGVRTAGGASSAIFPLVPDAEDAVPAGRYTLTALAWRRDVKSVRGLVRIVEAGGRAREGWLEVNGALTHGGTSLFLTAWGEDPEGRSFLGVQYRRDRFSLLFWAGAILLAAALPPFVALRRRPAAPGERTR